MWKKLNLSLSYMHKLYGWTLYSGGLNFESWPCLRNFHCIFSIWTLIQTYFCLWISERCGPVIGGGIGLDPEPPQPLVTREPSVSLLRWEKPVTSERRRTEPVSLATLERDCFVIPAHALDRFLPDGVPVRYTRASIK